MSKNYQRSNRYQPTSENFILRMKKLLCDLASQADAAGTKPKEPASSPPERDQKATDRP